MLAFAEESQAVQVTRAGDRLEIEFGSRPPVPRRFFSRWNLEIDNVIALSPSLSSNSKVSFDFALKVCELMLADDDRLGFTIASEKLFLGLRRRCIHCEVERALPCHSQHHQSRKP